MVAGNPATAQRDPFDALGNLQRRAILGMISARPRSVQELADALPISRPAVSRHLRVLAEAGLVRDQRVGTRSVYRLDEAGLDAVRESLEEMWSAVASRFRLFAENTKPEARS